MAGTQTQKRLGQTDIREHADKILEKLDAQQAAAPDQKVGDGGVRDNPPPGFTDGKKADLVDGKPVVPDAHAQAPAFSDGARPPQTQDVATPPAAAQQPPATSPSAAGAAAVEAAAQQIAEDMEEWNFHDPDLDIDIPIKYPKKFGDTVKRGYGKRSALDRELTFLKEASPVLRPLIADGRMRAVLPLITRALEDNEYGEFVTQAYQRRVRGEPLVQQALREVAQAAAAPPPQTAPTTEPLFADPFLQEQFAPIQAQFDQRLAQMQQRLDAADQARQRAEQQQQTTQQQAMENDRQMRLAHQDLAAWYPGVFDPSKGANDPMWQRAIQQAQESGYLSAPGYGLRGAIVQGGHYAAAIERERVAATASPAAAALAQTDQALVLAAQREAARSAGAAAGGAAAHAPAPTLRPKPTPRDANGNLRDKDEFMTDMAAWLQEQAALAQTR